MSETKTKPTLVILAAGMGSRYGGLKQMDRLGPGGETIIDYSVFDAVRAGFGKVVCVIRRHIERDFREVFGDRFHRHIPLEVAFQELDTLPDGYSPPEGRTKPWGTAHAVWVAKDKVNEPFAVINADDFYGRHAFEAMAGALASSGISEGSCCMVGYRLKNTLSDQGSVSRGVCTTDDRGNLTGIVERKKIHRSNNTIFSIDENGKCIPLNGDSYVSMNFWGFAPGYFLHTEKMMHQFLETKKESPDAEFYIPEVVNSLIREGKATCEVLQTAARWFGVTYPGDRDMVVRKLNDLTSKGEYPSPLWENT